MQLMNYRQTRTLLAAPFPPAQLSALVWDVLSKDGWHLGQPEGQAAFATWLNPVVDDQRAAATGVFDLGAGKAIMALAIHYFSRKYPRANHLDIASASSTVEYCVTGMRGGFGTDDYALEQYCEQLLMAAVGGQMGADGWGFIPESALRGAPSDDQTRILLGLIEGVYFKTQRPAGEQANVVREVIDLLNQTKHAFKSKQVEAARKKLETLL